MLVTLVSLAVLAVPAEPIQVEHYLGLQFVNEPDDWDIGSWGGGLRYSHWRGTRGLEVSFAKVSGEYPSEAGFMSPSLPDRQIAANEFALGTMRRTGGDLHLVGGLGMTYRDVWFRWFEPPTDDCRFSEATVYVTVGIGFRYKEFLCELRHRRTYRFDDEEDVALRAARESTLLCFSILLRK